MARDRTPRWLSIACQQPIEFLEGWRGRRSAALLPRDRATDITAARQKVVQVIEKLRGLRLTKAAELVETAVEETLAYYAFPEEHWRRIRTTDEIDKRFL